MLISLLVIITPRHEPQHSIDREGTDVVAAFPIEQRKIDKISLAVLRHFRTHAQTLSSRR